MTLPFYDILKQRLLTGLPGTTIPGFDPQMMGAIDPNQGQIQPTPENMPAMQPGMTIPELPQGQGQSGIVAPEGRGSMAGYLLPLMLTQIGAALMQPPDQRGAVFAQLPTTMLAAAKMSRENRKEDLDQRRLDLWEQKLGLGTDKNLTTDQLLANALKTGDQATVDRITAAIQGKKPPVEKGMQIKTVQEGNDRVSYQWNPITGEQTEIARGPAWNPKEKPGMTIETMPDGTVRMSQGNTSSNTSRGGAGGVTGMQSVTVKDVEKGLLDVTEGLSDTHRINNSFDPSFATIGGQWDAFKSRVSDKLGYQLSPDAQKQFEGFTGYRAEAGRVFANTLKKLSGTAVTEPEMKRQEVYLINPGTGVFDGDSPSQVKTKIEKMMGFQRQAIARLNYIRKNGLSIRNAGGDIDFGGISLDRMPGIMKGYGQQVTKQLIDKGMKENSPELIQAVQAKVAEHFGLVQ